MRFTQRFPLTRLGWLFVVVFLVLALYGGFDTVPFRVLRRFAGRILAELENYHILRVDQPFWDALRPALPPLPPPYPDEKKEKEGSQDFDETGRIPSAEALETEKPWSETVSGIVGQLHGLEKNLDLVSGNTELLARVLAGGGSGGVSERERAGIVSRLRSAEPAVAYLKKAVYSYDFSPDDLHAFLQSVEDSSGRVVERRGARSAPPNPKQGPAALA